MVYHVEQYPGNEEPTAQALARALGGKRNGTGWMARCPAHDDHEPSLAIGEKDGRTVFRCHAKCSQEAVLAAFRERGLWPVSKANGHTPVKPRIVATYDYCDQHGELLFQSVRYSPKTFKQRRPDGNKGDWLWNLKGIPVVPYRLPGLQEAIGLERPVFVVEGERDCDNLVKLGITATTNHGGAGKWRAEHAAYLKCADVVIIPDNDPPGRAHADSVARSLAGIAARVRMLELPGLSEKGDVSDWLAAGGMAEQLWQLAENAPDWTGNGTLHADANGGAETKAYKSRCMAEIAPEPVDWLWYQRIARGKANLLAGHPGGGKSQLTLFMASKVSTGGTWPDGAPCQPGAVVLVSCEDDAADTIVPRLKALGADLSRIHILDWVIRVDRDGVRTRHLFDLGQDLERLEEMVCSIGEVALINIDPVSAYLGALDSHKTSDVRGALAPLQELAGRTKAAVLLVSHLNKGTMDVSAMARVAGSGAFVAACRSAWLVETDPQDHTRKRRILTPLKNNIGDDRTGFAFHVESVTLLEGIETSRVVFEPETVEVSALELLRGQQDSEEERGALGEAEAFLRQYLGGGQQNAKATKKAAVEAGVAERTLRRARERLRVRVTKSKVTGAWVWALPGHHEDHVGQEARPQEHGHLGQVGQHEPPKGGQDVQGLEDGEFGHLAEGRAPAPGH